MQTKDHFKSGDLVTGTTLTGQKIIGKYIRSRASFGVIVQGHLLNEPNFPEEFTCTRLSLRRVKQPNTAPSPPGRPAHSIPFGLIHGDPCTGLTVDNKFIRGTYAGAAPKPYAYIRGMASAIDPIKTYKVTRESLKKTA